MHGTVALIYDGRIDDSVVCGLCGGGDEQSVDERDLSRDPWLCVMDVHRAQGSATAEEAIKRFAQLFAVEKEARGSPPERRVEIRQAQARPIFDNLETWLHAQLPSISGKSPLAGAIRYALTRMARLRPYLDHGILELDNNTAERAMRFVAIGRKNFLFVGSQTGGRAAAIAYTLIETAKLNGLRSAGMAG